MQEVFHCLFSASAREDFLSGNHGAPQLSESDLQKLDTFYSLVSIDRQNLPGSFNVCFILYVMSFSLLIIFVKDVVTNSATHFQHLLEGRNKDVAGSTYREIKVLVQSVIEKGYFDWKPQPEAEPEPIEPEVVEPVQQEAPTSIEVCITSH